MTVPDRIRLTGLLPKEPRRRGSFQIAFRPIGQTQRMAGRTIYSTATTLDGFLADEHHSLDWLFEVVPERPAAASIAEFMRTIGAMAMGGSTYDWIVRHERLDEQPEKWRSYHGDIPCFVFTHRERTQLPDADIRFVAGDVAPVHAAMVAAAGDDDIWLVGGGDLVGQFADAGLLDEIDVAIAPVTLGRGAPLLPRRLTTANLELADVRRDGQFARLRYRVR